VLLASEGGRVSDTKKINYLIRWVDQYQRHKKPSDLVVATFDNKGRTKANASDVIYKGYGALRSELKKIRLDWFDPYHCRHFYITNRLLAGEPIHIVARVCGTHVLTEMASRNFGNRQVIYNKEGGYGVVEKDKNDNARRSSKKPSKRANV